MKIQNKKILAENVIIHAIETTKKPNSQLNQIKYQKNLRREFSVKWLTMTSYIYKNISTELVSRTAHCALLCNLTEETSEHILNCNNLSSLKNDLLQRPIFRNLLACQRPSILSQLTIFVFFESFNVNVTNSSKWHETQLFILQILQILKHTGNSKRLINLTLGRQQD